MTDLIDAARRLADVLPECPCWYELPGENAHKPECHVPVLPQIVRALERLKVIEEGCTIHEFDDGTMALRVNYGKWPEVCAALRGEPSQNAEAGTSI